MFQVTEKRIGRSLLQLALAAGLALTASRAGAQQRPVDSDLYCSGFYSTRAIETGLSVKNSEEAGFKYEFTDRDYLYLSRGQDTVVNTGGQYILLRPGVDNHPKESFPGQQLMLKSMGTLYAEVGRIEIKQVSGAHATAQVLHTCEPIEPGDIALPLNVRNVPAYKASKFTARFADPSGKATGAIATAKEFDRWLGESKIVYLNIGSAQGLQAGSYLRIRRPFSTSADTFSEAARNYLDTRGNKRLPMLQSELAAMPNEVLGEVMVLAAEENSATAIITYARLEVVVGDLVELE